MADRRCRLQWEGDAVVATDIGKVAGRSLCPPLAILHRAESANGVEVIVRASGSPYYLVVDSTDAVSLAVLDRLAVAEDPATVKRVLENVRWARPSHTMTPTPLKAPIESSHESVVAPSAVAPESSTRPPTSSARRAHAAATLIETVAWLYGALGVISGVWLTFQTEQNGFGETDYPYVAQGLGLVLASVLATAVVIMIAAYIQSRTE